MTPVLSLCQIVGMGFLFVGGQGVCSILSNPLLFLVPGNDLLNFEGISPDLDCGQRLDFKSNLCPAFSVHFECGKGFDLKSMPSFRNFQIRSKRKIPPVTRSVQIWTDLHHFPVEQLQPGQKCPGSLTPKSSAHFELLILGRYCFPRIFGGTHSNLRKLTIRHFRMNHHQVAFEMRAAKTKISVLPYSPFLTERVRQI